MPPQCYLLGSIGLALVRRKTYNQDTKSYLDQIEPGISERYA